MGKQHRFFALVVAASVLAFGGCTCRTGGGVKQQKGEIGVIFGEEPKVTSRDAVYDFGSVFMGQKQSLKLTVKNLGLGTLGLEKLEKDSGAAVAIGGGVVEQNPVFEVVFEAGRDLGAAELVEFDMVFNAPNDDREKIVDHEVRLILRGTNTLEGEETAVITLKGRAISGVCELPKVIDFGSVATNDIYKQTVEIKNPSQLEAVATIGDVYSTSGDHQAFTFAPESARGTVSIPPDQTKKVVIGFTPTEIKDYLAFVKMRASAQCPEYPVRLVGKGVDNVLIWSCNQPARWDSERRADCDFGYVTPGVTVTREVTFRNAGNAVANLSQIKTTSPTEFKVVPEPGQDPTKLVVPGQNGEAKLVLSFKPSVLGPRSSVLGFSTNLARQTSGAVQLRGYGGGPDIQVTPHPTLNFGKVAYFSNASPPSFQTRKLTVMNVGTKPVVPDPSANLKLLPNGTAGTAFKVEPVAPTTDTSEISITMGPGYDPAVGLEASAGKNLVDLLVKVTPTSTGQRSWKVTIYSNDPDEPETEVGVVADVVVLPPCRYSVSPSALNFGLVTPPDYKDLAFTIKNDGRNAGDICLLSNLDLASGSDKVFTLPGGTIDSKEMQPGETLQVIVRAWPQGTVPQTIASVTGNVQFFMSSDVQPQKLVALQAAIAQSCLTIAPDEVTFGTVQKGCSSSTRTFSMYNTCSVPLTISGVTMQAAAGQPAGGPDCPGTNPCPEFLFVGTPAIGGPLNPGAAPVTFAAKYKPIDLGSDTGAIAINVVQNGTNVTYIVTLEGKGDTVGIHTDVFTQDSKPKADIILVIDNSGSMGDEQQALAQNFGSFIKYAVSASVDYHIAVTTTDNDPGGEQGKFVSGSSHPEKVLSPTTADVENKFKAKVNVGTSGSATEMCFDPALKALTAPLITADNSGFLRNDAALAVVCVSDELEQSAQPPTFFYNSMLNIKGAKRANLFTVNAIAGFFQSPPAGCSAFSDDGRYAQLVSMTNGVKESICTPNWSKSLEQLGKTAFGYRTNFYLTSTPDLTGGKVITVKVDGVVQPEKDARGAVVWTYEPVGNSVNFEPMYVPEPGQTLTITYYVTCFN